MHIYIALRDAVRYSAGAVYSGSVLLPIVSFVRGSARAVSLIARNSDEFLFSYTDCSLGINSRLVTCANSWGFDLVEVYGKAIVRASANTWEIYQTTALDGGSWALAVHKGGAADILDYCFLIGYFMNRLSRPQACVSAYPVALAENAQSARFDATILVRLEELQRFKK